MKYILLTIMVLTIVSCTTDNQAQDSFTNCLSADERQVYVELVELCDDFIRTNYPDDELNDGYLNFLNDLGLTEPSSKTWTYDTLRINEMSEKLKKVFGETYKVARGEFSGNSKITACLKKNSTTSAIDEFVEHKEHWGSSGGPHIVASGMKAHNTSPTKGLNKTIFVTEVVWRLVYLNISRK